MQWGSRRRFAVIGGGSIIIGLLILTLGVFIAASTYSYFLFGSAMVVLGLVLMSTGTVVLVVGSLRAS